MALNKDHERHKLELKKRSQVAHDTNVLSAFQKRVSKGEVADVLSLITGMVPLVGAKASKALLAQYTDLILTCSQRVLAQHQALRQHTETDEISTTEADAASDSTISPASSRPNSLVQGVQSSPLNSRQSASSITFEEGLESRLGACRGLLTLSTLHEAFDMASRNRFAELLASINVEFGTAKAEEARRVKDQKSAARRASESEIVSELVSETTVNGNDSGPSTITSGCVSRDDPLAISVSPNAMLSLSTSSMLSLTSIPELPLEQAESPPDSSMQNDKPVAMRQPTSKSASPTKALDSSSDLQLRGKPQQRRPQSLNLPTPPLQKDGSPPLQPTSPRKEQSSSRTSASRLQPQTRGGSSPSNDNDNLRAFLQSKAATSRSSADSDQLRGFLQSKAANPRNSNDSEALRSFLQSKASVARSSFMSTESDNGEEYSFSSMRRPSQQQLPVFSPDAFAKIKTWLKSLRLHKYLGLFEQLSYNEMMSLTETDLEKMGVTAAGARKKIIKEIDVLRNQNAKMEDSIRQLITNVAQPNLRDLIVQAESTMDIPLAEDDPDRQNSVLSMLFLELHQKIMHRLRTSGSTADANAFSAMLEKSLRCPMFSSMQRSFFMSMMNECATMTNSKPIRREGDTHHKARRHSSVEETSTMKSLHSPAPAVVAAPPQPTATAVVAEKSKAGPVPPAASQLAAIPVADTAVKTESAPTPSMTTPLSTATSTTSSTVPVAATMSSSSSTISAPPASAVLSSNQLSTGSNSSTAPNANPTINASAATISNSNTPNVQALFQQLQRQQLERGVVAAVTAPPSFGPSPSHSSISPISPLSTSSFINTSITTTPTIPTFASASAAVGTQSYVSPNRPPPPGIIGGSRPRSRDPTLSQLSSSTSASASNLFNPVMTPLPVAPSSSESLSFGSMQSVSLVVNSHPNSSVSLNSLAPDSNLPVTHFPLFDPNLLNFTPTDQTTHSQGRLDYNEGGPPSVYFDQLSANFKADNINDLLSKRKTAYF